MSIVIRPVGSTAPFMATGIRARTTSRAARQAVEGSTSLFRPMPARLLVMKLVPIQSSRLARDARCKEARGALELPFDAADRAMPGEPFEFENPTSARA